MVFKLHIIIAKGKNICTELCISSKQHARDHVEDIYMLIVKVTCLRLEGQPGQEFQQCDQQYEI